MPEDSSSDTSYYTVLISKKGVCQASGNNKPDTLPLFTVTPAMVRLESWKGSGGLRSGIKYFMDDILQETRGVYNVPSFLSIKLVLPTFKY